MAKKYYLISRFNVNLTILMGVLIMAIGAIRVLGYNDNLFGFSFISFGFALTGLMLELKINNDIIRK